MQDADFVRIDRREFTGAKDIIAELEELLQGLLVFDESKSGLIGYHSL